MTEDANLITAYLKGDNQAFETLVGRHISSVYALAKSLVREENGTEDVVQETFVKVWKNIKKFDTSKNFRTWILTITRNTALDYLRKRRHIPFSGFEDETGENRLLAGLAEDAPTPEDDAILGEHEEVLREAMEKLSPTYREILELRYQEELTFEEIASVTGRPMNTVKSQCRRALIELRKQMPGKDG